MMSKRRISLFFLLDKITDAVAYVVSRITGQQLLLDWSFNSGETCPACVNEKSRWPLRFLLTVLSAWSGLFFPYTNAWAQADVWTDIPATIQIGLTWIDYLGQGNGDAESWQLERERLAIVDLRAHVLEQHGIPLDTSGDTSATLQLDIVWLGYLTGSLADNNAWELELRRLTLFKSLARALEQRRFNAEVVSGAAERLSQLRAAALIFLKRPAEAIDILEPVVQLEKKRLQTCQDSSLGVCDKFTRNLQEYYSLLARANEVAGNIEDSLQIRQLSVEVTAGTEFGQESTNDLAQQLAEYGRIEESLNILIPTMQANIANDRDYSSNIRVLQFITRRLFRTISWDRSGSTLRSSDPADFMGMRFIDIGRQWKYGMLSQEEDYATFSTMIRISDLVHFMPEENAHREELLSVYSAEAEGNWNVHKYVSGQLSVGNLEPVAKYLYFTELEPFFDSRNQAVSLECNSSRHSWQTVTIAAVRRRVIELPAAATPTTTVKTLELMDRILRDIGRLCGD